MKKSLKTFASVKIGRIEVIGILKFELAAKRVVIYVYRFPYELMIPVLDLCLRH